MSRTSTPISSTKAGSPIGRRKRRSTPDLLAYPCLVRIVVRKTHHRGGDALLLTVEFADLHRRVRSGVGHIEAREGDGPAQQRRAQGAGHHAYLGSANMHRIAVPDSLGGVGG